MTAYFISQLSVTTVLLISLSVSNRRYGVGGAQLEKVGVGCITVHQFSYMTVVGFYVVFLCCQATVDQITSK